ncbi:NAD(P)/FAD-dependent oxidoreductase [Anaeromyxobacter oryzae]|uniref:Protoporphyrinogen oxidase n=1 Tax=Anaeromyxobacter oryzae TaxID=2918170 RepID=A0ABM7WQJ6_9BACT|nr:NAD(P)/FAD-dependent oxidoreductase [Anaeromyxobacter oryzae]BDG01734.1 protoporphyrinogen oxidase [Anaeromyxobacter oryzae]
MSRDSTIVVGAGPAGLTAAYLLAKAGSPVTVFEADPEYVGGISRTVRHHGFHFDVGGHRFFSKSRRVEDFWTEILPGDMLERPRSSRIYYRGKFYSYPLRGTEALLKLGPVEAARCLASYVQARAFPIPEARTFQDWVTNQFGERLFEIFFKTYTEKVWGMSCREISADWAAQRIKGLNLTTAVLNALLPRIGRRDRSRVVKTLIDSFRYPRKGPGMMWEACAARTVAMGGRVELGAAVTHCAWDAPARRWTVTVRRRDGSSEEATAEHVISSAPLSMLERALSPSLSARTVEAIRSLRYRDFITVAVMLRDRDAFDDNWIYIHEPGVKVGRIQNFKSWSPEMVPDPAMACYGLEYFCFEHDALWNADDAALVDLAMRELSIVGLGRREDLVDACVVRQPKAYPVYDDSYATRIDVLREELAARFPTFHPVGRNGMHKYNNQDHAMMTAMLTVDNILAGERLYDVWKVNQDAEYHEEETVRDVHSPTRAGSRPVPAQVGVGSAA